MIQRSPMNYAKRLIQEKLDLEGIYDAEAPYEIKGSVLREAIAKAFRDGQESGARSAACCFAGVAQACPIHEKTP